MKFLKLIGIFIILLLAAIIGFTIFVKSYLTDERLRMLVLPTVEKALGRRIELKEMKVKIFKGITLKELLILGKDGEKEFVSSKELVLKYKFLPMLIKKLVIDELLLISPRIYITRTKDERFNFDDLVRVDRKKGKGNAGISLLVSRVIIKDALLSFRDETKALPDIIAQIEANFELRTPVHDRAFRYNGDVDVKKVDFSYGGFTSTFKGGLKMNEQETHFDLLSGINDETVFLKGSVKDYAESPVVNLDIHTDRFVLDRITAFPGFSKKDAKKKKGGNDKKTKNNNITVMGNISIDRIIYKKMSAGPIDTGFKFNNRTFDIYGLRINLAEGLLKGDAKILLIGPDPEYEANLNLKNIQPNRIIAYFMPQYSDLQTSLEGKVNVDSKQVDVTLAAGIFDDTLNIKGTVRNYRKQPDICINLTSKELNIDKLLSLLKGEKKVKRPEAELKKEKDDSIEKKGMDFTVRGEIDLKKVIYEKAEIYNLKGIYTYGKSIIRLENMGGGLAGGQFNIKGAVDLRKPGYEYRTSIDIRAFAVEYLVNTFIPQARDTVFGKLDFDLQIQGAGTEPEYLKKALNGKGSINVTDGKFIDTGLTQKLSAFFNLEELNRLDFQEFRGNVQIGNGLLRLNSGIRSPYIEMKSHGSINILSENIDFETELTFSETLTKKMVDHAKFNKYLVGESGKANMPLKVSGTLSMPVFRLDARKLAEREVKKRREKIQKRMLENILKNLKD
ncbi:MAG: AsmA family protein [Thermodesulfobacteriota bacterium]|nr:AsmA family protein [Thermodesulfobacteriota bacterium]